MSARRVAFYWLVSLSTEGFVIPAAPSSRRPASLPHGSSSFVTCNKHVTVDACGSTTLRGTQTVAGLSRRQCAATDMYPHANDDAVASEGLGGGGEDTTAEADGGAPADTVGELEALDSLLGLNKAHSSAGGLDDVDDGLGALDALDGLLSRGAPLHAPSAPMDADGVDNIGGDGFGELDNLLGLDDRGSGPLTAAADEAVVGQQEEPTIDVHAEGTAALKSNGETEGHALQEPSEASSLRSDSVDDLLSENLPSAPQPADDSSSAWFSNLMNIDGGAGQDASSKGAGASKKESRRGRGVRSHSPLDSLIDEVSYTVPGLDAANFPAKSKPLESSRVPSAGREVPQAPLAIDDWLDDLLEERSPSVSPSLPPEQPAQVTASQEGSGTARAQGHPPGQPWDLWDEPGRRSTGMSVDRGVASEWDASDSDYGGNDGGGGAMTGSKEFERWTSNMVTPTRHVMGRDSRVGRGSQETFQARGNERRSDEEEYSRGAGWGDGASWEQDNEDWEWERRGVTDEARAAQRAVTKDLKVLKERGQWEDAIRVLVGARVRGIPVNVFMYNSAISAVSKRGRYKEALSMMEQMQEDGVDYDVFTFSGAITACGKGGKPRKALSLLDEMQERYDLAPDMVCYGAAVQACAEAGMSSQAVEIMERMTADGFTPDKMAFNAAINACGFNGEWEKALDILGEMRASGLRPNQHSYRLAMTACGNGGKWERALSLLSEMEEDGITPGILAFQAALDTLKDAGQWEKAMSLLEEMDELGVVPTEECFTSAVAACAEVGRWHEACSAMRNMRDLNLQPSLTTYNYVMKACVRGKMYSRALTTMTDLRKSGKRPEQETWELVVEACVVCGRWECAVEVVRDMFAEEVWYDMEKIRAHFFDCPSDDLKRDALGIIALQARDSAKMKRRKQNNMRVAKKRKERRVSVAKPRPKRSRIRVERAER